MAYVALYRKWRPQDFDALVGQQAVKQALTNALTSGKIAHAYLFAGPRGTGKTSTARILAKALNCEQGPTPVPCGRCENCRRITEAASMDVFEIDAASNRGIDEIKALRDQLAFSPVECRYKVYIIDEVHMLTTEAFNALLKTLEEPPEHVIFILATTDPHKIPATIHSRCQRFDFRRVTVEEIAQHLAMVAKGSGLDAEEEALRLIAVQSEGGMRDALSLLDQCGVMDKKISVGTVREVLGIVGREALREMAAAVGKQDVPAALACLNALLEQGKDVRQILTELAEYLRALLLYQAEPDYNEVYLTDTAGNFAQLSPLYTADRLLATEDRLHAALLELRGAVRPRITAELCLIDICRREGSALANLSARIEALERQIAQGGAPSAQIPALKQERGTQRKLADVPPDFSAQDASAAPSVTREGAQEKISAQPGKNAPPRENANEQKAGAAASEKTAPVVEKAAPAAQKAALAGAQPSAAPSVQEFGGDFAAGEDFWQQALELVRSDRKNAIYSCAKQGRVYSFANNLLVVAFKNAFICERMSKPDYAQAIEDKLLRLSRRQIRLRCETEEKLKELKEQPGASAPPAGETRKIAAQDARTAPAAVKQEELPKNLQKAMQAFGGTVTKVE